MEEEDLYCQFYQLGVCLRHVYAFTVELVLSKSF